MCPLDLLAVNYNGTAKLILIYLNCTTPYFPYKPRIRGQSSAVRKNYIIDLLLRIADRGFRYGRVGSTSKARKTYPTTLERCDKKSQLTQNLVCFYRYRD